MEKKKKKEVWADAGSGVFIYDCSCPSLFLKLQMYIKEVIVINILHEKFSTVSRKWIVSDVNIN